MAGWLGAFWPWFRSQPLPVQRAAIRERLDAYMDDPLINDIRASCPPTVRIAFDDFREAVRKADWTVVQ